MYKRYFRMKDPRCKPNEIEWIEMAGSEFCRFVNSPEGCDRHFIDMDDVVLEASEFEARSFKAEKTTATTYRPRRMAGVPCLSMLLRMRMGVAVKKLLLMKRRTWRPRSFCVWSTGLFAQLCTSWTKIAAC